MRNKKLIYLLIISTIVTGCARTDDVTYSELVSYEYDNLPDMPQASISEEDIYFLYSNVPSSIGDVVTFTETNYNGVYIETLDDNLIDYTKPVSIGLDSMTMEDVDVIMLEEDEAWYYISDGLFDSFPNVPYGQIKDKVAQIAENNTAEITVNVWYWEDPNDDTNMNKVTRQKTWTVNKKVASLFEHIFNDIYNHPDKPVINLADTAMGTWVMRGKMHSDSNTLSAHAIGTAIDINPSTGSYNIGGTWYGNGYGQAVMSAEMWAALPESHTKYHVLYAGCPIVETFKAYGFYWGGDWNSPKDNMHLSYLGDGGARETGIKNYLERMKKNE